MLDKVKETVTKPAIRKREVRVTRTGADRITLAVDCSDAMWLEDLAETAMHARTVRFALRLASREPSELGQASMEPTRFEVVEAERDPKKPTSDAVEEGDWTLHLNTVGFEHTPDGAFYLARIVSERVMPKAMNDELRAELERVDADVDRRAREAFLVSVTAPAPPMDDASGIARIDIGPRYMGPNHTCNSHNAEVQSAGRCSCATCPYPTSLLGLDLATKGK